jgi:hypothetical protein
MNRKRIAPLFCAPTLILIVAGTAEAATVNVPCSGPALISAIATANATAPADMLNLAGGCTYGLTAPDNARNGLPVIKSEIKINGRGATIARRSSAPAFRVLLVGPTGTLTLDGVTVSGGRATDCPDGLDFEDACGGGIDNQGTLRRRGEHDRGQHHDERGARRDLR